MDAHAGVGRQGCDQVPARSWRTGAIALAVLGAIAGFVAAGLLHLAGTASDESHRAIAAGRALAELHHLDALRAASVAGGDIAASSVDAVVAQLSALVDEATDRGARGRSLRVDARRYESAALIAVLHLDELDAVGRSVSRDPVPTAVDDPLFRSLETRLAKLAVDSEARSVAAASAARWGVIVLAAASLVVTLGFLWWLVRVNRRAAAHLAEASAQARFRSLVDASHDEVYLVGPGGEVWYASPAAERSWGTDVPADLETLLAVIEEPERQVLQAAFDAQVVPDHPLDVRVGAGDAVLHLELVLRDLRDDPVVGGVVVTARDVTAQRELQELLSSQALEDELTGLPNRRSLNAAIGRAVARAQRHCSRAGVILVDLDEFKAVNDTLGHPAGDELLRQVAKRLRETGRAGETIGRLGGDEFAIVLEEVGVEAGARCAAARFLEALRVPFDIDGRTVLGRASLGLAVALPGHDADDLLRHADGALYEAKRSGGDRVVVFRPEVADPVAAGARVLREPEPERELSTVAW